MIKVFGRDGYEVIGERLEPGVFEVISNRDVNYLDFISHNNKIAITSGKHKSGDLSDNMDYITVYYMLEPEVHVSTIERIQEKAKEQYGDIFLH